MKKLVEVLRNSYKMMLTNQHLFWKTAGTTTTKKGAAVNFNRRFFGASVNFCPDWTKFATG
jgi:hypothetical protein